MGKSNITSVDWLTVLMYTLLVIFGWLNIISSSMGDTLDSVFDMNEPYGKQALWIGLSVVLIVLIFATDTKFYERFSGLIFVISMLSLLGLHLFGKTISGATSWYVFGPVSIQPSEFAKVATALALSMYVSDLQTNIKRFKDQLKAFLILLIPAILVTSQPDPGSAIIYAALIFPLYREGVSSLYISLGFGVIIIFVLTLVIGASYMLLLALLLGAGIYFLNRKKKNIIRVLLIGIATIVALSYSVDFVFYNVFKQHHRDRFNIVLGKEVDAKGIGYNTNQSEIAIGNGGWLGKGWTKGTQTKGNFVPEQHTDYIFSTVGEEWGFLGSFLVVVFFSALFLRLIYLAERQKRQFNRVYGYSVASIMFMHFFVNVGMVLGVLPTVGIPLPFFSYGGSGLWGFTMLLFVFLKLDADRMKA